MAIKVLHLSDIHFRGKDDADQKIVIGGLTKSIARIVKEGGAFDVVVFSGDLVHPGSDAKLFAEAKSHVIDPIIAAAGVTEEAFFICAGNHDIDRNVVRRDKWVEPGLLATLKSRTEVNDFIDAHKDFDIRTKPFPDPIKRLENYYLSIMVPAVGRALLTTPFVQVFKLNCDGKSIGLACFNSAWRTTGEPNDVDQGNLIVGERTVDQAAEALENADLRVAVVHHPIAWLHDPDQAAVEGRLQANFDLLLSGHVHRPAPEFRKTMLGEIIHSQAGSLYNSREYFNGYNVLTLDLVDRV